MKQQYRSTRKQSAKDSVKSGRSKNSRPSTTTAKKQQDQALLTQQITKNNHYKILGLKPELAGEQERTDMRNQAMSV